MAMEELKKLGWIALGLVVLPVALDLGGLTYSTAVECIVLAMAGLALNILLGRSEEHTSELQSLMRISYAVFCLKKNNKADISSHFCRYDSISRTTAGHIHNS